MIAYFMISFATTCVVLGLAACGAQIIFRKKIRPLWRKLTQLEEDLKQSQSNRVFIEQSMASALAFSDIQPRIFTSQYGEDLLIWSYFERSVEGFFVEIGGFDGITFSNTYALEKMGWKGLVVEADPGLFKQCDSIRRGSLCVHAAVGDESAQGNVTFHSVRGKDSVTPLSFLEADEKHRFRCDKQGHEVAEVCVPYRSVNSVLEEAQLPRIDVLSIDIEGMELQVLEAIDYKHFSPQMLIVEANSEAARIEVLKTMSRHGYELWRETCCNLILVRCSKKVLQ